MGDTYRAQARSYFATLTFAGSRQGVTRTLPLEIYLQRESDPDAAVALSNGTIGFAGCTTLPIPRIQSGRNVTTTNKIARQTVTV